MHSENLRLTCKHSKCLLKNMFCLKNIAIHFEQFIKLLLIIFRFIYLFQDDLTNQFIQRRPLDVNSGNNVDANVKPLAVSDLRASMHRCRSGTTEIHRTLWRNMLHSTLDRNVDQFNSSDSRDLNRQHKTVIHPVDVPVVLDRLEAVCVARCSWDGMCWHRMAHLAQTFIRRPLCRLVYSRLLVKCFCL